MRSTTEARVEILVDGLDHPEGVCWDPARGCLWAGGEAGQLYRVDLEARTWTEVSRAPGFVLGLALDGRGRVVACCREAGVQRYDGGRWERLPFATAFANVPALGPDGALYVSDSGSGWGANDGRVLRDGELLSDAAPCFTNGLAVSPDGGFLWVAESYEPRVGRIELASGRYEQVVRLDGTVPDGLAFDADGGLLVACYRPDRIVRLDPDGGVDVVADDPQGTLLGAPTNVCFAGPELDVLVAANLGRWHLALVDAGLRGAPLHRPA